MADARTRLESTYGAALPPGLAALPEAEQQKLADAVDAAVDRQRRALAAATDQGLGFIPRLLRGPVKKVMFG